ncbi:MAG TPA: SRPBCC family protein [Saprospiraceae bacterium]|nr:SRPBCC family protein [Saprospiraceae bacterium]
MSKKLIWISAAAIMVLGYSLLCLISPSSYKYNQEIKIDGPYKMVYLLINDFKDWPKWISWQKSDPDLVFTPGPTQVYVGASFKFDGNELGTGKVELESAYQDSLLTARMDASALPDKLEMRWQIVPEGSKSVYVTFVARMRGQIPFWKRALHFGMKDRLDGMFEQDLEGLKLYIEGLIQSNFGILQETYAGRKYFGIMDIVPNNKIPAYYAKTYPKVYQFLDSMGVAVVGPPAGLIMDWEGKSGLVAIVAAYPVEADLRRIKGFTYLEIPPTQNFKLEHFGSYNTLRNAHAKLSYIMDNSPYELKAPIIEEYVTSPSQEPDTSKWLTNIHYLFENKGSYAKTVQRKLTLEEMVKMEDEERNAKLKDLLK